MDVSKIGQWKKKPSKIAPSFSGVQYHSKVSWQSRLKSRDLILASRSSNESSFERRNANMHMSCCVFNVFQNTYHSDQKFLKAKVMITEGFCKTISFEVIFRGGTWTTFRSDQRKNYKTFVLVCFLLFKKVQNEQGILLAVLLIH